jgi:hypothetical protein
MEIFGYTLIKTEELEQFKLDMENTIESIRETEKEKSMQRLHQRNMEYATLHHDLLELQQVVKEAPDLEHKRLELGLRDQLRTFFPYEPWISRLRKAAKVK